MKSFFGYFHFVVRQAVAVTVMSFLACVIAAFTFRVEPVGIIGIMFFALVTASFSVFFTLAPIALGALCAKVGATFHPEHFQIWSVASGIFAATTTYYLVHRLGWLPEFDGLNWEGVLFFGLIAFPSLLAWQRLAERHLR